MTDITDQDRRDMLEWADYAISYEDVTSPRAQTVARYILATVDAPPPTLAEELARIAENSPVWTIQNVCDELKSAAARAEQMEHDLAEARAEVKVLDEDLAGAESEVERLTAERDRLEAAQYLSDGSAWGGPVREPTVQKGAESNAETPNPADVKPGEAWKAHIWYDGVRQPGTAIKSAGSSDWVVIRDNGSHSSFRMNEYVELVSRLVPAPRIITDPDDLDTLPHNSVILSADNDAWQKSSETNMWASAWWATINGEPSIWSSRRLCDEDHPVTVLWEPGV